MSTLERCLHMLDRYEIPYVHTRHSNAYRACEVAEAEHLPPYMLAKTVIVYGSNKYSMAVLPADCKIDLEELAITLGLEHLRLATEEEVRELFPDSEVGAMPPLGPLFGISVYMDIRLAGEPYILFNAGTHRDAIRMRVADYVRLADPTIIPFAQPELRLPFAGAAPVR